MPANTWSVYKLESVSGYNIILPKDTADFISFLNNSKVSGSYSRVVDINSPNSKFLDGANVKYLIALPRTKTIKDSLGHPADNISPDKYRRVFT